MKQWSKDIVEHTSDGLVSLGHDRRIRAFNRSAERIFGYKAQEVIGQPLDILLPTNIRQRHNEFIDAYVETGILAKRMARHTIVSGIRKDGSEFSLYVSIIRHVNSEEFSVSAICRDSASIEILERDLGRYRDRLNRVQSIAKLGYWDWNNISRSFAWSDEIFHILGMLPGDAKPTFRTLLKMTVKEDRYRVCECLRRAVKNEESYSIIYRIKTTTGAVKVIEQTGKITQNASGDTTGMEGIIQDISQYWRLKESLVDYANRARIAEQTQSQFPSIMSHELRTPLNAISGFTELLKEEVANAENPRLERYIEEITNGSNALLKHINEILIFSRMSTDGLEANPSHFEALEFFQSAVRAREKDAQKRNIEIRVAVPSDIGPLYLDKMQCRQILDNLLSNAIKFSDCDSVIIVGIEEEDSGVVMFVKDRGIGMTKEECKDIFTPFHQAHMDLSRAYEGIGLGLSIVKNFTECQGGHVEVSSTLGEGSTFKVHFPDIATSQNERQLAS